MAGHPQNSPRGLWAKLNLDIPTGGGIKLHAYSDSSNLLSGNSTGLVVAGAVKLSNVAYISGNSTGVVAAGKVKLNNAQYIGGNSTCYLISRVAAVPSTRNVGGIVMVSNSTGTMLAFHQTGTTWQYLNITSVLA